MEEGRKGEGEWLRTQKIHIYMKVENEDWNVNVVQINITIHTNSIQNIKEKKSRTTP